MSTETVWGRTNNLQRVRHCYWSNSENRIGWYTECGGFYAMDRASIQPVNLPNCKKCAERAARRGVEVPDPPPVYPEHDKLKAIQHLSQEIHDFLEWCEATYEVVLFEPKSHWSAGPISESNFRKMLHEYFKIDPDKIEAEKQQMLDRQRKLNEVVS